MPQQTNYDLGFYLLRWTEHMLFTLCILWYKYSSKFHGNDGFSLRKVWFLLHFVARWCKLSWARSSTYNMYDTCTSYWVTLSLLTRWVRCANSAHQFIWCVISKKNDHSHLLRSFRHEAINIDVVCVFVALICIECAQKMSRVVWEIRQLFAGIQYSLVIWRLLHLSSPMLTVLVNIYQYGLWHKTFNSTITTATISITTTPSRICTKKKWICRMC